MIKEIQFKVMNCLKYASTLYPFLPKEYLEAVCKLYPSVETNFIEERLSYYYSRNQKVDLPYKDLPYIFDKNIITKGNYIELVLKHPMWNNFANLPFTKAINTIEIPFARCPLCFPYLPKGVYVDEFVIYVEFEEFPKKNIEDFEINIFNLLEYKGTFLIISLPKEAYWQVYPIFEDLIFKESFKKRKYFYPFSMSSLK